MKPDGGGGVVMARGAALATGDDLEDNITPGLDSRLNDRNRAVMLHDGKSSGNTDRLGNTINGEAEDEFELDDEGEEEEEDDDEGEEEEEEEDEDEDEGEGEGEGEAEGRVYGEMREPEAEDADELDPEDVVVLATGGRDVVGEAALSHHYL